MAEITDAMVEAAARAIAAHVNSPNCAQFETCAAGKDCACRTDARLALTAVWRPIEALIEDLADCARCRRDDLGNLRDIAADERDTGRYPSIDREIAHVDSLIERACKEDILMTLKQGHACPIANRHYAEAAAEIERLRPVTMQHEAVGDNLVPQGPTFHWRNGWMFARGEALDVHVWNIERGIDLIIPRAEWKSLTRSLASPAPPAPAESEVVSNSVVSARHNKTSPQPTVANDTAGAASRNAALEEAAKVADPIDNSIAVAIRALKSNPAPVAEND